MIAQKNRKQRKSNKQFAYASKYIKSLELRSEEQVCPPNIFDTLSSMRTQTDLYTIVMSLDSSLAANSSGVIDSVIGNNPASTSNWASAAALFDEYRVLAVKLTFRPTNFNGNAWVQCPIATVIDYDTATNLTGYTLAAQYSSYVEYSGGAAWSRTMYMSGSENSGFTSTGSATNTFWCKLYSSGNTNNLNCGRLSVTMAVQFRGKGI